MKQTVIEEIQEYWREELGQEVTSEFAQHVIDTVKGVVPVQRILRRKSGQKVVAFPGVLLSITGRAS